MGLQRMMYSSSNKESSLISSSLPLFSTLATIWEEESSSKTSATSWFSDWLLRSSASHYTRLLHSGCLCPSSQQWPTTFARTTRKIITASTMVTMANTRSRSSWTSCLCFFSLRCSAPLTWLLPCPSWTTRPSPNFTPASSERESSTTSCPSFCSTPRLASKELNSTGGHPSWLRVSFCCWDLSQCSWDFCSDSLPVWC